MASGDNHLFVPGRLCIMGEHTDWVGSYRRINQAISPGACLVAGTSQGIYASYSLQKHRFRYQTILKHGEKAEIDIPMRPDKLLEEARKGGFFSYVAGTAYQFLTTYKTGGLVIENYHSDIPIGKGLSSSAAVCVLIARAFNRSYGLGLSTREEMEMAYLGETTTPSRCGRMDQICAHGIEPLLMSFDGTDIKMEPVRVREPLHFVVADLQSEKNTLAILKSLNRCFPYPTSATESLSFSFLAQESSMLTFAARDAMEHGDARELGRLMTVSQSRFDRYCQPLCPDELSAPKLHVLLSDKDLLNLSFGMKGIGSQGDGSIQILAQDANAQNDVIRILSDKYGLTGLPLEIGGNPDYSESADEDPELSELALN